MFPSLNIPDNTHLHAEMKEWLKEEVENELAIHNGIWRDPKTLAIYRCQKKKLANASFIHSQAKAPPSSHSLTTVKIYIVFVRYSKWYKCMPLRCNNV